MNTYLLRTESGARPRIYERKELSERNAKWVEMDIRDRERERGGELERGRREERRRERAGEREKDGDEEIGRKREIERRGRTKDCNAPRRKAR